MRHVTKSPPVFGNRSVCPKIALAIYRRKIIGGAQPGKLVRAARIPKCFFGRAKANFRQLAATPRPTKTTGSKSGMMYSCSTTKRMKEHLNRSSRQTLIPVWVLSVCLVCLMIFLMCTKSIHCGLLYKKYKIFLGENISRGERSRKLCEY